MHRSAHSAATQTKPKKSVTHPAAPGVSAGERGDTALGIDVDDYYRRFAPMVLRRCRRLLGEEELAVEAMQDTFVLLIRHQDRLRDQAPSSLLYGMATNVCLNAIRTSRRKPARPDSDLFERIASLEEPEHRLEARNLLARLFFKHRPSTREMAVLHLLDGMTLTEVAERYGMSVSGVRKRLRPLRAQLARLEGGVR